MAKRCDVCAKSPSVGHTVSHSNIKTLRRFEPNLQVKRMPDALTGQIVHVKICTACLRTMVKPPRKRNPRKRTGMGAKKTPVAA